MKNVLCPPNRPPLVDALVAWQVESEEMSLAGLIPDFAKWAHSAACRAEARRHPPGQANQILRPEGQPLQWPWPQSSPRCSLGRTATTPCESRHPGYATVRKPPGWDWQGGINGNFWVSDQECRRHAAALG